MGYDDRNYPGGAPPGDGYDGAPRASRWSGGGSAPSWVARIRAVVGAVLALPIILQVLVLLANYASVLVGHPLNLPPLITWAEAARLLRDALSALAVGGY